MKMHDLEKMCHVKRWHRLRVDREQTLAEHSFMVAGLSYDLYLKIIPKKMQSKKEMNNMFIYALFHDAGELYTGDIASPFKDELREIFKEHIKDDPFEYIEDKLFPEGKKIKKKVKNTPIKYIAKLADLLDAILFMKSEGRGHEKEIVLERLKVKYVEVIKKGQDYFDKLNWSYAYDKLNESLYNVSLIEDSVKRT